MLTEFVFIDSRDDKKKRERASRSLLKPVGAGLDLAKGNML